MANKQIDKPKTSKVLEILQKEYPFERILLGVLGALVIILGVYLIEGEVLEIRLTTWWIFNTATKRTIFSAIVILVGTISFFMAIWPFFVPSFAEMKKVTWPDRSTILNHTARVFGFILVVAFFFVLIDWPLRRVFDWIAGLGA